MFCFLLLLHVLYITIHIALLNVLCFQGCGFFLLYMYRKHGLRQFLYFRHWYSVLISSYQQIQDFVLLATNLRERVLNRQEKMDWSYGIKLIVLGMHEAPHNHEVLKCGKSVARDRFAFVNPCEFVWHQLRWCKRHPRF